MRLIHITLLSTVLVILGWTASARAERATEAEARTVAENYVALIVNRYGSWGGAAQPKLVAAQEFKRGNRVLGYYFRVDPRGFLVVSLHKELAAVQCGRRVRGRLSLEQHAGPD